MIFYAHSCGACLPLRVGSPSNRAYKARQTINCGRSFMLKKTSLASKTLQKLPAAPGLSEIHHFLSLAMEHRGRQVEITWATPDKLMDFSLNIQCPIKGGDTNWKLFLGTGNRAELLWDYRSCDVLLVYNLIVSSCGEVHQSIQAEGAITVSESFRDASRKRDTYFMQASRSTTETDLAKLSAVGLADNSWSKSTAEMTGELSLVPPSTLLQSILLSKSTGKVNIHNHNDHVQIYAVEGRAVYAEGLGQVGDECLLELMSLRDGKYSFEPRARIEKTNVVNDLETLIVRGVQLNDSITYLRHAGIAPESILLKARKDLTEFELSASLAGNTGVEPEAMLQLYIAIDDRSMLKQVTRMAELHKSQWVPALCHLIEKDFVTFSNEHVKSKSERANLQGKQIDTSLIHSVMTTLRRPETGMFTYPAFLYFLEQEYFRAYRSSSPLSLLLLEMRLVGAPPNFGRDPLDVGAVAEAFRRISQIKRHVDMVCHYDTYDYGLILPNTRTAGANIFARRILKALTASPLPGVDNSRLSIVMGIATVPDDCVDLAVLLSAAEAAKAQAVKTVSPVVLYQDVI